MQLVLQKLAFVTKALDIQSRCPQSEKLSLPVGIPRLLQPGLPRTAPGSPQVNAPSETGKLASARISEVWKTPEMSCCDPIDKFTPKIALCAEGESCRRLSSDKHLNVSCLLGILVWCKPQSPGGNRRPSRGPMANFAKIALSRAERLQDCKA